jgi:hypothetical protein
MRESENTVNARLDYQQPLDDEEHEVLILQALMEIAAHGLKEQAALLARECGLSKQWQATIRQRRTA